MQRKLTKRRIALIQLQQSQALYNQGDFVSSLTLAGAAEEIYGRVAEANGGQSLLGEELRFLDDMVRGVSGRDFNKKEFIAKANETRNHLKHADARGNSTVHADFEGDAKDMIWRALDNYRRAFGCLPSNPELRRIFNSHGK